jgi:hypothetical protein
MSTRKVPGFFVMHIPAPGGPIKIIRTESVREEDDCDEDPGSKSLASNCCTRDSSLCIVSRSVPTMSSVIGAIVGD